MRAGALIAKLGKYALFMASQKIRRLLTLTYDLGGVFME